MLEMCNKVGLSICTSPKISSHGYPFWEMSPTPGACISTLMLHPLSTVFTDSMKHRAYKGCLNIQKMSMCCGGRVGSQEVLQDPPAEGECRCEASLLCSP